ncbi:MAG: dihydroorotate dehydrogenase [Anaerovoracaceae bacterium]|jgi:dihydroorotate dehydrogenase (NAD+) catalytic subunit
MVDTRVELAGITLDNPIIPASGTFGFGREFAELYDLNRLGSIVIKGTTVSPREGNPQPRIAECPSGMLNSVGLENPGLERVVGQELPALHRLFHKPLIANISGFSVDEFVTCAAAMDEQEAVGIIEVNISCPNVQGGGMAFGQDPHQAEAVTSAVRRVTDKPVFVKLSPNVTDITEIARACEAAGADGLSLINTVLGMRIDIRRRQPVLANRYGGLSGPAVLPIALRMVSQTASAVDIPLMGMGGVSSAEDVIEMIMAGAAAVQIGAAGLVDPWACVRILDDLPPLMEKLGIENFAEIRGIV